VREVALAHLRALQVPEARNKRFLLSAESLWFKDIAGILKNEFRGSYKVRDRELIYCTVKLASIFDP
jgi:hypothetical protein